MPPWIQSLHLALVLLAALLRAAPADAYTSSTWTPFFDQQDSASLQSLVWPSYTKSGLLTGIFEGSFSLHPQLDGHPSQVAKVQRDRSWFLGHLDPNLELKWTFSPTIRNNSQFKILHSIFEAKPNNQAIFTVAAVSGSVSIDDTIFSTPDGQAALMVMKHSFDGRLLWLDNITLFSTHSDPWAQDIPIDCAVGFDSSHNLLVAGSFVGTRLELSSKPPLGSTLDISPKKSDIFLVSFKNADGSILQAQTGLFDTPSSKDGSVIRVVTGLRWESCLGRNLLAFYEYTVDPESGKAVSKAVGKIAILSDPSMLVQTTLFNASFDLGAVTQKSRFQLLTDLALSHTKNRKTDGCMFWVSGVVASSSSAKDNADFTSFVAGVGAESEHVQWVYEDIPVQADGSIISMEVINFEIAKKPIRLLVLTGAFDPPPPRNDDDDGLFPAPFDGLDPGHPNAGYMAVLGDNGKILLSADVVIPILPNHDTSTTHVESIGATAIIGNQIMLYGTVTLPEKGKASRGWLGTKSFQMVFGAIKPPAEAPESTIASSSISRSTSVSLTSPTSSSSVSIPPASPSAAATSVPTSAASALPSSSTPLAPEPPHEPVPDREDIEQPSPNGPSSQRPATPDEIDQDDEDYSDGITDYIAAHLQTVGALLGITILVVGGLYYVRRRRRVSRSMSIPMQEWSRYRNENESFLEQPPHNSPGDLDLRQGIIPWVQSILGFSQAGGARYTGVQSEDDEELGNRSHRATIQVSQESASQGGMALTKPIVKPVPSQNDDAGSEQAGASRVVVPSPPRQPLNVVEDEPSANSEDGWDW
ncbi:uncharacterized protein BJ171DRAFT_509192 [Polychytrium aggregatum]|uniref:uncharacterized protein n=1 Tax=Polychytrium aggregatum TaxID=110093 RepID=UPI0022FE0FE6|nr:uncharacterized protein BJ171DRAFT_509192 [Polychytrium aggregatum]KAI9203654.1 hypothetical protein BJ171DRAFT_509192 [Polychytrium aggregatum]